MNPTRRDVLRSLLLVPIAVAGSKLIRNDRTREAVEAVEKTITVDIQLEPSLTKVEGFGSPMIGYGGGGRIGSMERIAAAVNRLPWVRSAVVYPGPVQFSIAIEVEAMDEAGLDIDPRRFDLGTTIWNEMPAGVVAFVVDRGRVQELRYDIDVDSGVGTAWFEDRA